MTPTKKSTNEQESSYNADSIVELDRMAHVQKRVSLYLGSHPLNTCLREIVDNSIDEVRSGFGTDVVLTLHPDGSVQVDDSGRGLPTDINSKNGKNGIILTAGTIGAGGKFGDSNYAGDASMGLNGIGMSAVTATSTRMDVTVYRGGKVHTLSFQNGQPGHFAVEGDPKSKFTPSVDIKVTKDTRPVKEQKSRPTGTTIRYWSNLDFFPPTDELDVEETTQRLKYTAFLVPALRVIIKDNRNENEPVTLDFGFDGGVPELLTTVAPDTGLHDLIDFNIEGSFVERVPTIQKDGSIKPEDVTRRVPINLSLRWGTGYETTGLSFVNTIQTPLGGTHVRGLERALTEALGSKIGSTRGLVKAKEEPPVLDDMLEGLTYVLSIAQPEPSFLGQDKNRLGGAAVGKVVQDQVTAALSTWLEQRKNAEQVKLILQKVVNASHNRQAAKAQKEANRRKTALKASSMPAKLVDCSHAGSGYTELHIVEGDSALGSLRLSRDSRFQALLPIRGKILNTQGKRATEVLKNTEVADITQVLGAGFGKDFDVEAMRYERVVITADADSDGGHIRVLLITLFWNWMRPLVEQGRLYSSVPPLYSVKVKGKGNETIYVLDDDELEKVKRRLKNKSYKVSRFKGLGEMTAEEVIPMIDPKERTLRQITVDDAKEAERMLELAMGSQVEPRRDWIMMSRDMIDIEDLG